MKLKQGMREKPNGSVEHRFVIDGKRYSVTAKSAKELQQKEQDLRQKIAQGTYTKNGGGTLDSYYETWMERKKLVLKPSSIHRYMMAYNKHVTVRIGKMRLADIKRYHIAELQKEVAVDVSAYTSNWAITVLKSILEEAVKDGILKSNPAKNITYLKTDKRKAIKTIHRALTPEEQKLFLEEAKTCVYRNVFSLALASGMRTGEILALEWDDIYDGYIHIRRTIGIGMDGSPVINNTPKTEKSIRNLPVTATIQKILDDQRELSAALPVKEYPELIFHSSRGGIASTTRIDENIKRIFRDLNKKGAHIERVGAHALRDTFATRYIQQGGSMHTLRDILGHTSLSMTMDLYAHVMPDTIKTEMDRFIMEI